MSELQNFRDKEANLELAKKLNLLVWIISAAVLGLVVMMQKIKIPLPEGADLSSLPGFHALLNSMAAVFLVLAIRAIKKGKVILHQKMIYAAFICSLVFLLSYVTYHITTPATLFGDANKDGLIKLGRKRRGEWNQTLLFVYSDLPYWTGSSEFPLHSSDFRSCLH